jgi:hypothetical protein
MSRNINNNLVNRFQTQKNNIPFSNNALLNNNPAFMTNSKDSSFYNKINMAKMEQIKRAKNIEDMGIDKKQIMDLIISPIVINKTKKNELDEAYNEIIPQYGSKNNKILEEWWNTRTNQPYKNIIKKDLFNKDFKKYYKENIFSTNVKDKRDLLIHKITDTDSDSLLLEAEFDLLSGIIEKHNDELKVIYSASKKNKYKKEFEYVQNYRYRLEYNPKNSEELKDFYKKEQKKINKEKRMIDDVINNLIENDQLSNEEIEKLNLNLNVTKKSLKIENLEDELRKELGDDFEDIIDNIDIDNLDDLDNLTDLISGELDKKKKVKTNGIKMSSSISKSNKSKVEDIEEIQTQEDLKPKKKITVKTIKNNTDNIKQEFTEENKQEFTEENKQENKQENKVNASVSIDIKNKYKNRQ